LTTIRKIDFSDIEVLKDIGTRTFIESFAELNTVENMQLYLEKSFSLKNLEKELGNHESEFYFAEYKSEVIAYLKVNWGKAQNEQSLPNALEIERIYVLNEFQGMRIGKQLFEYAVGIANKRNLNKLWLGVWDQNLKAIEFYTRQGFIEFDSHAFYLGKELQTDLMMKLEINV